ncbi:hypothetical protein PISMIDRAFT_539750 [Pisolithus microcarpus 441]|uniref:Uncharacterized protein n=1 Tax=Pisolithus microcarpus 441 TaxID=765257 RepID=A0A0C9Z5R8_9AGAM|nr:hypothetical protein PISMIDRAFT_539750 [Pisolithus microcarpus 441]
MQWTINKMISSFRDVTKAGKESLFLTYELTGEPGTFPYPQNSQSQLFPLL